MDVTLQQIKRRIYAMRNGVVADSLRKAGCPRRFIFGLNLPQLNEIASSYIPSADISEALWGDSLLRESILLAPMFFPVDELTIEKAEWMGEQIMWAEEADILCFKLLRKARFANELAQRFCNNDNPMKRYIGLRLWFNIVKEYPEDAILAAQAELNRPHPISNIALMLLEEANFYKV